MSIESAKAYIERIKTDEDFREKVKAAEDQETRMALVKAEGFDFTQDEIAEAAGKISDDDIDVAAGASCSWMVDDTHVSQNDPFSCFGGCEAGVL